MSSLSDRAKGLIVINIAAVVFGASALFGTLAISVFWIIACRSGFAALSLLVFVPKHIFPLPKPGKRIFFTSIALCLHWLAFFGSVQLAGVAIATLTFATFPLFTVLLEAVQKRQHLKGIQVLAGCVIIAAMLIVVDVRGTMSIEKLTGIGLGFACAIGYAIFGVVSKKLGETLSPVQISFLQNGLVCIILLPFLPFMHAMPSSVKDWVLMLVLGMIATALMHQFYFYALKRLSAGTCSGFVALEPIYAILFTAFFLHQPITWLTGVSGVMIVGAAFTLLQAEQKT